MLGQLVATSWSRPRHRYHGKPKSINGQIDRPSFYQIDAFIELKPGGKFKHFLSLSWQSVLDFLH
jgi:hypothetical protein